MKIKQLIRRYTPSPQHISSNKALGFVRHLLTDPNLWHMNRRSVAGGVFIGFFCAWLPIPGQMAFGVVLCLLFKANLALTLACTWISNPLTYAPMFYFSYRVGMFLFGHDIDLHNDTNFAALLSHLESVWFPFLMGSFLCGFLLATTGYIAVRIYWRLYVMQIWQQRRNRKKDKQL